MPITSQGKTEFLNKIKANSIWLGLFTFSGPVSAVMEFDDNIILNGISVFELEKIEYERIEITPANWDLDDKILCIRSKYPISFTPTLQNWENIQGFFLSTSEDNTGKLINIYVYKIRKTILKNNTLVITPQIILV